MPRTGRTSAIVALGRGKAVGNGDQLRPIVVRLMVIQRGIGRRPELWRDVLLDEGRAPFGVRTVSADVVFAEIGEARAVGLARPLPELADIV